MANDKTQSLSSHLWNAANILRGSAVGRTDWKGYILPLLFFKRICDVWDEETAEAAEIYGDTDPLLFPDVHRFEVPEGCHWRDIRETPANVGTVLAHTMQEIERVNPDILFRVFGTGNNPWKSSAVTPCNGWVSTMTIPIPNLAIPTHTNITNELL
jgi:type I restriction enzyme M protein